MGPWAIGHGARFWERLPAERAAALLAFFHEREAPLRVGTVCSGSDLVLLPVRILAQQATQRLPAGQQVIVQHVFSCEKDPLKQAWIRRWFQPAYLYSDVMQLDKDG